MFFFCGIILNYLYYDFNLKVLENLKKGNNYIFNIFEILVL